MGINQKRLNVVNHFRSNLIPETTVHKWICELADLTQHPIGDQISILDSCLDPVYGEILNFYEIDILKFRVRELGGETK